MTSEEFIAKRCRCGGDLHADHTHFDLIHQAAGAGKAIFCEKPIDLSTERTRECIAAVEAAGVPFMTAFNRRFDPGFAHLQSQLRHGLVGDIELVTILSRDPSPPPVSYIESQADCSAT
jgi:myo-inositol 2-dehydrogenase/D-chiro-inositol 1-dehydrogenase